MAIPLERWRPLSRKRPHPRRERGAGGLGGRAEPAQPSVQAPARATGCWCCVLGGPSTRVVLGSRGFLKMPTVLFSMVVLSFSRLS